MPEPKGVKMLRPGWTDAVLRMALLVLVMGALNGCATQRGSSPAGAATAANQEPPSPEPPSPELQARYASLLDRLQAGDKTAMTDLEQFSAENPELAGPLLNLGLAHARDGDEVGARALLERAGTVCSRCGPVWNQLGVLDRQQGRFADAEQAYLSAIELEPEYAPAYYNLAVLYELYIPRPELALENYERYLQIGGAAGEGQDVEKWAADLRRRVDATAKTASAEGPS
jgi:tetratricopeptide (TPR) repeat protein